MPTSRLRKKRKPRSCPVRFIEKTQSSTSAGATGASQMAMIAITVDVDDADQWNC
jgi:hypothetical protein